MKRILLVLSILVSQAALAQDWSPTKAVRVIVPIVGSTNDVLARLIAPKLSEAIGQPVVVENRGGAGGNIGADLVAKSEPDGHTLLIGYNGPIAVNVTLFRNMPYDPQKDLTPVTLVVTTPQFFVVNPSLPVKNVGEFVAYAKANPGKVSYGSVSIGSASHLTMEMLKTAAKIDVVHVPYKGAPPVLADLLAGNIQAGFFVPGNVLGHMKGGKLRAIAATGTKRFAAAPEVGTMIEQGFPDFEATAWIGYLAPGGTPRNIIERYNREIVRIAHLPEVKGKLEAMQFEVVASTPEYFRDWIAKEIPRWGAVIKATGATAE
ncbi:MAG TPA: tripartite tricarboxylate transporter substrate binding protein [Burkholderiales bacterium]|nr:tripartite tricarboxylate transporter substrate binding protein [Burkholderiales bacterium]